ncbi:N-acetylglucosaminyldiphosphoundecaprenol N-acetyl-beta-D-mannosaminyltransferase [Larkinella arboricola]|uniref:N-acetylglucosaminyldiphosphoundecaprenol N-acetyl-beta-D-mannosaminyltransferase n=1 Tax=Larkinella arboricola TaxID=643671 RepID=A0A327X9L9_LARAB|nr:WecB/TagA/CpsF family glycosyltransferase [Larkinella arboricola]RAK02553.1 N-acetylglucosaminyldiphosphoundecaprenol N-acetyl-beta-D-mannosaminyltransferase [Larkinella arboricola]
MSLTSKKRATVISLNLSLGNYRQFQDEIIAAAKAKQTGSVCFANVHMTIEAKFNSSIAEAVNGADWVLCDGVPLLWSLQWLYGVKQNRATGLDMLPDLLQNAEETNVSVFFYGSTPETLQQTIDVCRQKYPKLKIAGTLSPPFRPLTPEEDEEVVKQITQSGAGLVFVSLGCPKQEMWMAKMRGRIPAVLLGIGGALPVLAGDVKRSPEWMQRAGLEWLFRFIMEPRRLFKRYAVTNSLYTWYLMKQLIDGNHHSPYKTSIHS